MTSVVAAWLHPGWVDARFMNSMLNLVVRDSLTNQWIIPHGGTLIMGSGPNLSASRNQMVRLFLETECDWLWMVDSDMTFEPDLLDKLMAVADPEERPIVGGLCHGKREDASGVHYFPTLYFLDDAGNAARLKTYPKDTAIEVHATGAACLLVHRSVFEAVAETFDGPWHWFAEEIHHGGHYSEDVVFCIRARKCGFPVTVFTGADVGHVKSEVIDATRYADWLESQEV